MKYRFSILALGWFLSVNAFATPILWQVDATFDDGGVLSGSFIFDEDISAGVGGLQSLSFSTSTGSLLDGNGYTMVSNVKQFLNESTGLGFLLVVGSDDGASDLTINIKDPGSPILTNAGGAFQASPSDWDELDLSSSNRRRLDNQLSGTLASVSVSEPATFGLLALGFMGLGISKRKRA